MAKPKSTDLPALTAPEFRVIRQRLGWSMAEMGRRFGGDVALIASWEDGSIQPGSEALNQFVFLANHVDQASAQVAQTAVAETIMETAGLAQLTHRELIKDL